jgi:3-hydroxyisobutyrate dehydrogenase-like beta-hydroxyacid dehydrogenase
MNVSVLGLGQMGSAICERLMEAGHAVAVWNRTAAAAQRFAERGAVPLARPAGAWEHGDVAIVMVADTAAVEAVAGELLSGGGTGRTVIDMSTISLAGSRRLAERAEAAAVAFLRAPVSGNPSVVAAGNLGIVVSGPRAAYDAVAGLLGDVGPHVFHVGAADEARVVKLGLNLMIAGTAELMAEALVLAERHGIDRATMLDVMGGSAMGSPFVKYKTAALVADDYSSTFSAHGLHEDVGLALECADEADVPLPVTGLVAQLLQGCIATGMGDIDLMALLPRLRREAGLA